MSIIPIIRNISAREVTTEHVESKRFRTLGTNEHIGNFNGIKPIIKRKPNRNISKKDLEVEMERLKDKKRHEMNKAKRIVVMELARQNKDSSYKKLYSLFKAKKAFIKRQQQKYK